MKMKAYVGYVAHHSGNGSRTNADNGARSQGLTAAVEHGFQWKQIRRGRGQGRRRLRRRWRNGRRGGGQRRRRRLRRG